MGRPPTSSPDGACPENRHVAQNALYSFRIFIIYKYQEKEESIRLDHVGILILKKFGGQFWGTLEEGHWGSAGGGSGGCMPKFGNAGRASY
mgnify:CR=1 FL=1